MKVLTAAQMREIDRRTVERGVPSLILMENAGHRVMEALAARLAPLDRQRIVVVCGKGNNGGDGLVVARQLLTRVKPRALHVVLAAKPEELQGDAAANYRMFVAAGGGTVPEITAEMRCASLVVDALLGTGLKGAAAGRYPDLIRAMNAEFPLARVVAVDTPSGMASDVGTSEGECVRADITVTFTAPKLGQVLSPNCDRVGELIVSAIGSAPELFEEDASITTALSQSKDFAHLFEPRPCDSNKGMYGHLLVIAGARGKTGAAAMAGISALRAGAGLVTVASAESAIEAIGSHAPELMTDPLEETDDGAIGAVSLPALRKLVERKTVVAVGPGMGTDRRTVQFVRKLFASVKLPLVADADGLNALAGSDFRASAALRVLTPHPGEMARLCAKTVAQVQADRLGVARSFAAERGVCLILKGNRTVIALPDGRVWINPTGSPAMATGGTGDILTGLIAGLLAQFPKDPETAVRAAVWLHGRAGE
ncbi:MAG: NAD(P)H-hydrate dehydratase, partial [Bryobacteraceae bacterium]